MKGFPPPIFTNVIELIISFVLLNLFKSKQRFIRKLVEGFTLLEMLLVIAIITIITVISPPLYTKMISRSAMDSNVSTLVSILHKAQSNSLASLNNSSWGVQIDSTKFVLFKGDSYTTRDVNFDEEYKPYENITTSGDNSIIFPTKNIADKKYQITISDDSASTTLNINELGVISF